MELLECNAPDHKRIRMGRPPKIPPYSHYDAYKKSDIEFFISLFTGRAELYNPCETFTEERQKLLHFIEKKCGHFMAMRKGRNAEKLWLYLFNDFEKFIRNASDRNDKRSNPISVYYDCMKFLRPYLKASDETDVPSKSIIIASPNDAVSQPKRSRLDEFQSSEDQLNDDWLQKVMETLASQQAGHSSSSISFNNIVPEVKEFKEVEITKKSVASAEKHSDIISCVTNFLEKVPNEKLMLCKVRLFQFIEEEKSRLQKGI